MQPRTDHGVLAPPGPLAGAAGLHSASPPLLARTRPGPVAEHPPRLSRRARPPVHAAWLELGWALRPQYWGLGYATEIGRAALGYAFDVMGIRAVVSCTVRHNARSVAVMRDPQRRIRGGPGRRTG